MNMETLHYIGQHYLKLMVQKKLLNLYKKTLLKKNPENILGITPLHQAARKGNFEAFLLIKEKVDDINPKNEHGNT